MDPSDGKREQPLTITRQSHSPVIRRPSLSLVLLLLLLLTFLPLLFSGIDATPELDAYTGGIFAQQNDFPSINHEVAIVGWGTYNNVRLAEAAHHASACTERQTHTHTHAYMYIHTHLSSLESHCSVVLVWCL